MERCKLAERVKLFDDCVINDDGLKESFPAVNHSMADGVNLSQFGREVLKDQADGTGMIRHRVGTGRSWSFFQAQLQGCRSPDVLYGAIRKNSYRSLRCSRLLARAVYYSELEGRASAVENEDSHTGE